MAIASSTGGPKALSVILSELSPQYPFPIDLCKELNLPITTTSVNETGSDPLNDPALIIDKFGSKIDLIIDAGKLPKSRGSKIYKLKNSKFIKIRS